MDANHLEQLKGTVDTAERQAALVKYRLAAVITLSRKFAQIKEEEELIDSSLHAIVDLACAVGAVFVPLDERGHPLAAVGLDKNPFPIPGDWVEYLATPAVRERCQACEKGVSLSASCPLLKGPFSGTRGLHCLPVKRNDKELGMINLYLPEPAMLDGDTQDCLLALADMTALALDGLRLRRQERETWRQIQNMDRTALTPQQAARLEFHTILDERTRLAREIHDGLAQTLGFLKLQVAQMQSYLERNDLTRLRKTLTTSYKAVAEAYQEARFAIDGLRISPSQNNSCAWVGQIVDMFKENLGDQALRVNLETDPTNQPVPSEVQAQLMRILQEALSNVRSHSQARNVWIRFCTTWPNLELEIRDDGRGFCIEDVTAPSQHGLRGMRERAELIGADFQVISDPLQGTVVKVTLPLKAVDTSF